MKGVIDSSEIPFANGGPVKDYHVFCGAEYLGTLDKVWFDIYQGAYPTKAKDKIYNNAFIYHHTNRAVQFKWWRMDGTPRSSGDVPKAFIVMATLVT
jgi:hypothetical protein